MDHFKNDGMVKTDMYCHDCGKNFIAKIDYNLTGNHIICCVCGHEHCRVIVNGVVTGDRWDSKYGRIDVEKRNVWTHSSVKMETSSVSHFLRERWLNRSDN